MKKLIPLIIAFALVLASCGGAETPSETAPQSPDAQSPDAQPSAQATDTQNSFVINNFRYDKTPVDITFTKAPERIVAVSNSAIKLVLAYNREELLVGVSGLEGEIEPYYKDAFDKLNYIPEGELTREKVLELSPDLIVAPRSAFAPDKLGEIDFWQENGVNTYMMINSGCTDEYTLEQEYADITNIGIMFSDPDKTQKIVNNVKKEVMLTSRYAETLPAKLKIAVLKADDLSDLSAATTAGDLLAQMGAEPVSFASPAELKSADPDVIFVAVTDGEDTAAAVKRVAEDPELKDTKAAKDSKVRGLSLTKLVYGGDSLIDIVIDIQEYAYPDRDEARKITD